MVSVVESLNVKLVVSSSLGLVPEAPAVVAVIVTVLPVAACLVTVAR